MLELNPLIIPTKTEYLISQFKIPSNAKTCSRRANLHYCNCNYIMLQIKLNHQRPASWDEATWFKCQSGQLEIELSQDRVCSKGNAIGWKSATLEQREEFLFYYGISRLYSAGRDCQCKHSAVFVSTTPPLSLSPQPGLWVNVVWVWFLMEWTPTISRVKRATLQVLHFPHWREERATNLEMSEMIYVFFPGKNWLKSRWNQPWRQER